MDWPRTPRRRLEAPIAPTTLIEITRRYYACAIALSKAMGLPISETFIREHRESISCCFIEAGRAGVRLPSAVQLPPLTQANGLLETVSRGDGDPVTPVSPLTSDVSDHGSDTPPEPPVSPHPEDIHCTGMPPAPEEPTTNGHRPPVAIPREAGLPCGGVAIADLKPAQLAMVINRVARLVHDQGERWVSLLGSLQIERARRLERGRKAPREG